MMVIGILNAVCCFRTQGSAGLFKGLEAKLLQTVLTAALMILCYEKIVTVVFKLMGEVKIKKIK